MDIDKEQYFAARTIWNEIATGTLQEMQWVISVGFNRLFVKKNYVLNGYKLTPFPNSTSDQTLPKLYERDFYGFSKDVVIDNYGNWGYKKWSTVYNFSKKLIQDFNAKPGIYTRGQVFFATDTSIRMDVPHYDSNKGKWYKLNSSGNVVYYDTKPEGSIIGTDQSKCVFVVNQQYIDQGFELEEVSTEYTHYDADLKLTRDSFRHRFFRIQNKVDNKYVFYDPEDTSLWITDWDQKLWTDQFNQTWK